MFVPSHRIARAGGWAALIAGILGAAAAIFLIVVPAAVPETVFGYPPTPAGHLFVQTVIGVQHLLAAVALWALWRSGLAGPTRFAAVSGCVAAGIFALFGVWEFIVGAFGNEPDPSPTTDLLDSGYATFSILVAVSLVIFGIAVVRARALGGVSRWGVIVFGIFLIVPGIPLLSLGFLAGRVVIGAWLLILIWIGWAMLRSAKTTAASPHAVEAVA